MIDVFKDYVIPLLNKDRELKANFVWGDSAYIREYLLTLKKSSSTAPYRFPLIGLYSPFDEIRDSSKYKGRVNLNLILAVNTLPQYTNEQRLEVSFKQCLRPLYDDFMKVLSTCGRFDVPYNGIFSHSYTENYSFGKRGAIDADGKEIDEKIDAIEIKNLELTIKNVNCYANRL